MDQFDVVVIGAGPAGATLATLLSQSKHRVLLIEKSSFPRYRIGESLLPATVRDLADMLGIRDQLAQEGYMTKKGATFSWGNEPDQLWSLNFGGPRSAEVPLPEEVPSAFNVPRDRFDRLLIDNAVRHGVEVRYECRVTEFVETDGVVSGVIYEDSSGGQHTVAASMVADASGQRSKLARTFGERTLSTFFRKVSAWGYYRHGKRLPAPFEGNVLFQTIRTHGFGTSLWMTS